MRILNNISRSLTGMVASIFVVFGIASSCSTVADQSKASQALNGHVWMLTSLEGADVATDAEQMPQLSINVDSSQISGFNGCNRFSGTIKVTGTTLELGTMASTRMACPDGNIEQQFEPSLNRVRSYKTHHNVLELLDSDGKVVMKLAK